MEKDLVVTEIICIFALRIKTLSVMSKKYKKIVDEPMLVSDSMSIPMTKPQTEQLEALWTLIKSQGRQVQEVLLDRLSSLFHDRSVEIETSQHLYVKESLHRAFENMRKAEACGEKEQTLDAFLEEL